MREKNLSPFAAPPESWAPAQRLLAGLPDRPEGQRIRAQDDWGLVEVVVDPAGRVREVAINADLAGRTNLADLAESVLQAARAAQSRAEALSDFARPEGG